MFQRFKNFFVICKNISIALKTGIKKAGISAGKNGSNIHIAKKRQHKEKLCTVVKSLICESQIFFEIFV